MPATVMTNNGDATKLATKKHHSKKTRVVRRRGRGGLDSDEEIEREAQTDSDTDDDSSLSSESESESVSEDDEHHAGIVTPSTTQSPPPLDVKPALNGKSGPFVGATDWAQIVADENAHGAEDLPVIDFADMHTHTIPEPTAATPSPRSRKAQKQNKKSSTKAHTPTTAASEEPTRASEPLAKEEDHDLATEEPVASTSRTEPLHERPLRGRGQSARQAYQERLQADPAFVPRVGEFWGHDDRLLDKDLRSLSGWWRGRWQGRGRGRGGFSMRGRGGFYQGHGPSREEAEESGREREKEKGEEKYEVPPIDRAWTHDGFEEMKRREEQRREEQRRAQGSQQSAYAHRGGALRGRGAFAGRGRGGFSRGGGVASPVAGLSRAGQRPDPSSIPVWYAMKPEKMWTKHADNFLYFEHAFRPRPGDTPGFRVKLPGHAAGQVVRPKKVYSKATSQEPMTSSSSSPTEESERHFVVRIPASVKVPASSRPMDTVGEQTSSDIPIEEVFKVRPHAAPEHVPLQASAQSQVSPVSEVPVAGPSHSATASLSSAVPVQPMPEAQKQLEQLGIGFPASSDSNGDPSPVIQETLLRNPPRTEMHAPVPQAAPVDDATRPVPPVLSPLQTSFSPVPQASPPYGSPYPYGALPPGIAMSHQGYAYELATGRPVYLQPTPPPMYAPRPMMQSYMGHPSASVPFVPAHMHHPSQEYMPQPHTPPVNGFADPATGVPIFTPPRQSSRIEIRAPDGQPMKPAPRPSGLRTSTTEHDVKQVAEPSEGSAYGELQSQQPHAIQPDPAVMAYPAYQQPYYYPDPNGYSGYVDMSTPGVQYDLYPPYEQHAQPIIYY